MFVDDVNTSAEHRLNQILHTLKHVYETELDLDAVDLEEIKAMQESSEIVKNSIVSENAFNSWHSNPVYTKNMLILEATRLYITEIAPKRRRAVKESADIAVEPNMEETTSHTMSKHDAHSLGRWMVHFSEENHSDDPKIITMLNGFARVGSELTRIGEPFGPKTVKALVHGFEVIAHNDESDDDERKMAKDSLTALRIAQRMYKKRQSVAESLDSVDSGMQELMVKYGIVEATTEEGNAFSGALAAAKAAGKEEFEVDGKTYKVDEQEIDESIAQNLNMLNEEMMEHHDYQASMARAELYRNSKYGVDMLKMIHVDDDVEPWIAAALTKAAMYLDKIYHYLDYYTKFEPSELAEGVEDIEIPDFDDDIDLELGETTGSIARQNLTMIIEYSMKLFHIIEPGDKLEGWVAMKLTSASECISSSKHYLDYKRFEHHGADHFDLHEGADVRESMSRKDFRMFAKEISSHPDPEARRHLGTWMATLLAQTNPRFDRERFLAACDPKPAAPKRAIRESAGSPEQELAQAQTLIAAKSMSDELQSMAEKVARMSVDDLMPLVDNMKTQFGPEAAEGYNSAVKAQLDSLLQAVQSAKSQSDDAVLALQSGGVPGVQTDISAAGTAPVPAEMPGAEMGDEEPEGDGFGTTPSDAGGEEPLGRAKKPAPGEEEELAESWGTEMHTAAKDKGKWDGWTLAKLKTRKKKLMDKESRSAAEQKEVKQIDFAIRAKQKDKWGKVDEAKAKPDFLDVDKDGDKKEPMKKALKDKEKTEEAAKSPYAIGMWQAKKEAGMDPDKPAKGLPKKVVVRAHKIGKSIEGTDESIRSNSELLEKAQRGLRSLQRDLDQHRAAFARRIAEGVETDPLLNGQGLEGDLIQGRIATVRNMIETISARIDALEADSWDRMRAVVEKDEKAYRFAEAKARNPWGVVFESDNGKSEYKFFGDEKARDFWVQLNKDKAVSMINPEHFDIASNG